jgi:hypothetical protein
VTGIWLAELENDRIRGRRTLLRKFSYVSLFVMLLGLVVNLHAEEFARTQFGGSVGTHSSAVTWKIEILSSSSFVITYDQILELKPR